jgi:hypothetical protein
MVSEVIKISFSSKSATNAAAFNLAKKLVISSACKCSG